MPDKILIPHEESRRYGLNMFEKPKNIDEHVLEDAVLYKIYSEIIDYYKNDNLLSYQGIVSIQGVSNTLGISLNVSHTFDEATLKIDYLTIVLF